MLHATGPEAAKSVKDFGGVTQQNVRDYFIGTVGLVSGSNAFLHATGPRNPASQFNTSVEAPVDQAMLDLSPTEVALASSSLPPLTPVSRPTSAKSSTTIEPLMDGGFAGNFGLQISNDLLRDLGDTATQLNGLDVIALDAGRFIAKQKPTTTALTDASTVARLSRSIQVAADATYKNDIQDLIDIEQGINTSGALLIVARSSTSASPTKIETLRGLMAHIDLFGLFNPAPELQGHDPTWIALLTGFVSMFIAEADAVQAPYDIANLEKDLAALGAAMDSNRPTFLRDLWRSV